jgi:hypothetical protein
VCALHGSVVDVPASGAPTCPLAGIGVFEFDGAGTAPPEPHAQAQGGHGCPGGHA